MKTSCQIQVLRPRQRRLAVVCAGEPGPVPKTKIYLKREIQDNTGAGNDSDGLRDCYYGGVKQPRLGRCSRKSRERDRKCCGCHFRLQTSAVGWKLVGGGRLNTTNTDGWEEVYKYRFECLSVISGPALKLWCILTSDLFETFLTWSPVIENWRCPDKKGLCGSILNSKDI